MSKLDRRLERFRMIQSANQITIAAELQAQTAAQLFAKIDELIAVLKVQANEIDMLIKTLSREPCAEGLRVLRKGSS